MNAVVESVRSLWIPLKGMNLVLPNVAVAEIIPYRVPELLEDTPEWLLGSIEWRQQILPLVAFEAVCGRPAPLAAGGARIAVLNNVKPGGRLAFYALLTAGIPRLLRADAEMLAAGEAGELPAGAPVACGAQLAGESAVIPDMERLQDLVESAWRG